MPTYEYDCAKCQHHFETYQRITDPALTICPKDLCPRKTWGKGKVKRAVVAGGGLIFKGSGFYETDYRSEGYKAAAKKEAAASSGGSTDGAKKETASASSASKEGVKKESKPAESVKTKADGSTPAKSG